MKKRPSSSNTAYVQICNRLCKYILFQTYWDLAHLSRICIYIILDEISLGGRGRFWKGYNYIGGYILGVRGIFSERRM